MHASTEFWQTDIGLRNIMLRWSCPNEVIRRHDVFVHDISLRESAAEGFQRKDLDVEVLRRVFSKFERMVSSE